MKKPRWNFGQSRYSTIQRMKPLDKQMTVLVFSIIIIWIMLLVYFYDNKNQSLSHPKGIIFDLDKSSHHFNIDGFEYFEKNPVTRRQSLSANKVWFLRPTKHGTIAMKHVQAHLHSPTEVSVLIKYHSGWISQSKLSVSGINYKTHEMVTTDLSQYGNGYCTKVIFLGMVNEVTVEGSVQGKGTFVIIDELLIGLGLNVFDEYAEESCS